MTFKIARNDNIQKLFEYNTKAKLQKEGIFFLIHLFARYILLMRKLEIEETETT